MNFPYFNLTNLIQSDPHQGIETILIVTANKKDKIINFKKVQDVEMPESATPGYFERYEISITTKQGLAECQADSKCRDFIQFWMKKGYKVNE